MTRVVRIRVLNTMHRYIFICIGCSMRKGGRNCFCYAQGATKGVENDWVSAAACGGGGVV